jgi:hypothetical protein
MRDSRIVGELSTLYQPGAPDIPEPILIIWTPLLFTRGHYPENVICGKYQPVNRISGVCLGGAGAS